MLSCTPRTWRPESDIILVLRRERQRADARVLGRRRDVGHALEVDGAAVSTKSDLVKALQSKTTGDVRVTFESPENRAPQASPLALKRTLDAIGGDEPGDVTQRFTRRDPSLGDGRQDKRVVVQQAKRVRDERGHGITHDSHDV